MCSYFDPVATDTHAAPMTGVILGCVMEKEHTDPVLTFFNEREIARAQQVARGLGEDAKQSIRLLRFRLKLSLEFPAAARQLGVADTVTQLPVNGLNRGRGYRLTGGNPLDYLP